MNYWTMGLDYWTTGLWTWTWTTRYEDYQTTGPWTTDWSFLGYRPGPGLSLGLGYRLQAYRAGPGLQTLSLNWAWATGYRLQTSGA
jgi:hypothetical protein